MNIEWTTKERIQNKKIVEIMLEEAVDNHKKHGSTTEQFLNALTAAMGSLVLNGIVTLDEASSISLKYIWKYDPDWRAPV